MLITCNECRKKLNVPDTVRGKKIRCPACQNILAVPGEEAAAPPPARKAPAAPPPARQRRDDVEVPGDDAAARPRSGMRCARCEAPALEELPANLYSRRPGYVCRECGAKMRAPGTTAFRVVAVVLGGLAALFGVFGVWIGVNSGSGDFQVEGGLTFLMLGLGVVGWALYQLRLPLPLDAPPQPLRLWLWVGVPLLVLLLLGAAVFGFMYYLHEML